MVLTCSTPSPGSPLLPALADYLGCHAQALGENGAQALAGGAIVATLLTSCLVIYVALIGYRLMLGQAFTVKDAVLSLARIALVITFCTRWPSYETVIYRVVTQGPSEVASAILKPSNLPVLTISETAQRIERAYEAVRTQTAPPSFSVSKAPAPDPNASPSIFAFNRASATASPTPQQGLISRAGVIFMVSTIGGLLAVRLAGAVILAVGPLIIALALFDSMLGVFEGWVRALFAVSLGAMGVLIVVAIELTFIESQLVEAGVSGTATLTDQGLMVVAVFFALMELGLLISAGLIARGFRLPNWRPSIAPAMAAISSLTTRGGATMQNAASAKVLTPPSRAQAVADAVTLQGQRERGLRVLGGGVAERSSSSSLAPMVTSGGGEAPGGAVALGSSLRRSALSRRTPSTLRRNNLR